MMSSDVNSDRDEFEEGLLFPSYYVEGNPSNDESDIDTAELEEMLYSQIYFEHNDVENVEAQNSEFSSRTPKIEVEEHNASATDQNSAVSSMLNFSARCFMCPQNDKSNTQTKTRNEPSLNLKNDAGVIEIISSTEETEQYNTSSVKLKMLQDANLQSKVKTSDTIDRKGKLVVLSDSDFEVEKQTEFQLKARRNRLEKQEGNEKIKVKKVKRNHKVRPVTSTPAPVISWGSSSESDGELMHLGDSGAVVENEDLLMVNADGLIGVKHTLSKRTAQTEPSDLGQISLEHWHGDPPLSLSQVHQLLRPDTWAINNDDLYGQTSSRYYSSQQGIECRNCKKRGHVERKCPAPKRMLACLQCGSREHRRNRCPETLCYNCNMPGHNSADCDKNRRSYRIVCNRCGYQGHGRNECPEQWRQYHLSTVPGKINSSKQQVNLDVYCYNCGGQGHFGYHCTEEGMTNYWYPVAPCISVYDNQKSNYRKRKYGQQKSEYTGRPSKKQRIIKPSSAANNIADNPIQLPNPEELSKKERKRLKKQKKQVEKQTSHHRKDLEDRKIRWKAKKQAKVARQNDLRNVPRFKGYTPQIVPGEQNAKAKNSKKKQKKQKERNHNNDQTHLVKTTNKTKHAKKHKTKASEQVPKTIFDSEVMNFPRGGTSHQQYGNMNGQVKHKKQKQKKKKVKNANFNRGFQVKQDYF